MYRGSRGKWGIIFYLFSHVFYFFDKCFWNFEMIFLDLDLDSLNLRKKLRKERRFNKIFII